MSVAPSLDRSPEPTRSESTLRDAAVRVVRRYLQDLNGTECNDLYSLMLRQDPARARAGRSTRRRPTPAGGLRRLRSGATHCRRARL